EPQERQTMIIEIDARPVKPLGARKSGPESSALHKFQKSSMQPPCPIPELDVVAFRKLARIFVSKRDRADAPVEGLAHQPVGPCKLGEAITPYLGFVEGRNRAAQSQIIENAGTEGFGHRA